MAKRKIQVETVEVQSKVEVIFLNSSFVAKTMRAQHNFEKALELIDPCAPVPMCCPEDQARLDAANVVREFLDELVNALIGEEDEKNQPSV